MKYKKCPACNGRGILPTPDGKRWQKCPRCGGRGKILVPVEEFEPWSYTVMWSTGGRTWVISGNRALRSGGEP
ncbi:MAG: hypothetical protein DRP11_00440 [Candidatus Aenigmatarchaeota archaeon]|nr:MAG: hypothetical protein DRP11_00440 [Candidatus Aenigmarchaeota archaeon]